METPKPENLFTWGSHPRRLYEALLTEGEVTNMRIRHGLRVTYYRECLAEISDAVRPYGLDIARRQIRAGLMAYRLAVKQAA
jgi:hypothetical protein